MTHWTEEQLADYHKRALGLTAVLPFKLPSNEAGVFARGELPDRDMNKTERAYDSYLWDERLRGKILWHDFECIKLRLADNTFYTPDFAVLPANGILEMREVKGFWRDDARVKIKVAASIYPFKFIAITKQKGGWSREEFS